MKKHFLSILALIVALAALIFALLGLHQVRLARESFETNLSRLEDVNSLLQAQILQLQTQTPDVQIQQPAWEEEAFCNLMVDNWVAEESGLTVRACYLQAQLPEGSMVMDTRLVLKLNGEVIERKSMIMQTGEATGVYELDVEDIVFALPVLQEDDQLTLWLEVDTSNGDTVSACGAEWYMENEELYLVSG